MPIKKPSVTYAEIYIRDLLIERDSASFYRNLLTQLDLSQGEERPGILRQWAKLDDQSDELCADGWLPICDEAEQDHGGVAAHGLGLWLALNIALAAESKAKQYYEGALKRSIDPPAQALAEKRIAERQERMQCLQALIAQLQPPIESTTSTSADAASMSHWVQSRIKSYGTFRFVHSEAA